MKKLYILILVFALASVAVFAQKKPVKKPAPKKTSTPAKKPSSTAKPAAKPSGTQNKTTTTPKTTTTEKKATTTDKKSTDTKSKTSDSKSKSNTSKSKTTSKDKKKEPVVATNEKGKKRKAALPYYQIQNFLTINIGFFYLKPIRTTSLPVYFNPELTLSRNFTIGIQAMHFQYKSFTQFRDDKNPSYGYTEYPTYETKYNHLLLAGKLSFHLNDIVRDKLGFLVNPEKMDLYVSGLAGYNLVFPNPPNHANELKLGAAIGGRILYSKRLAFYMEYGFSEYGYGSLGLSWLLGERF